MTAREPSHRTGPWKLGGMVMIAVAASGVLTACGDDDDAADETTTTTAAAAPVCTSLEALGTDVDALTSIDTGAGDGLVAELESSLESIKSDLEAVSADASDELADPVDALKSSVDTLSDEVATAKASGDPNVAAAQDLLDSAAGVSSSWVAVKDAAPDCDL